MKTNVTIYNTLTGKKDIIKPRKGKKINLFVCGPTVYDFSHLGHARTYVLFDCFVKYLRSIGYTVYYLQNITDIDDKIIARSRERGVSPKDLAEVFTKEYFKDMKALGVTSVTKYAKATAHIKDIISQVKRLQEKGFAYTLEDGIYFDISKFKEYGKLANRTSLQAEDGVSRIDYAKTKRNRGDFCLWKFNETTDEPSWPAPFGKGRPGWHIEDTAITEKFFGAQYDIHGGGRDLIFPHHEAEVTQMESISGKKPLAAYWMHTGFLTIQGQKMSKSLNNFTLINDFLKTNSYRHLRFWVAKNLWRTPLDYSESALIEIKANLERIEEFLQKIQELMKKSSAKANPHVSTAITEASETFLANLADDFNTPKAFATLFEFIKNMHILIAQEHVSKTEAKKIYQFFMEINSIFDIIDFKKLKEIPSIPKEVLVLAKQREVYRATAEWQKADEARKEIESYGYVVEDSKEGQKIKKKLS